MSEIMLHSGSFLVDGRPDSFSFSRFVVRDASGRKVKLPARDIIALTWLSGKSKRKWKVSAAAGAAGAVGATGLLAFLAPIAIPLAGFAAAGAAACTALGLKSGTSEAVTFMVAFKDRRFFSATAARSTFETITEAWMKVGGPAQTLDALTVLPAIAPPSQIAQSEPRQLADPRERRPGEGWERVALPAPEKQERGVIDAAFDAGSKAWTAVGDAAGYVADKLPELPSLDAARRWIPRLTWDEPKDKK